MQQTAGDQQRNSNALRLKSSAARMASRLLSPEKPSLTDWALIRNFRRSERGASVKSRLAIVPVS
jgi:hypothetical protein